MTAHTSAQPDFFQGFRLSAKIVSAIGGCLFLCGFLVEGVNGVGRAIGLLGISVFLCGIVINLIHEVAAEKAGSRHRRHLILQIVFTSFLAAAVLALAAYLYHYGHLPSFMPARYHDEYHVKRLT